MNAPDGLVAVPADEVADAIRSAGRGNPLLGIGISNGDPSTANGDSVIGSSRHRITAGRGPVDEAAVARLVDAVGGWLGTDERRVAASMVVLGYAARLVGPAVATLLRESILLDLRPSQVDYSFAPNQGFRLALRQPAGWRGTGEPPYRQWCDLVIDQHLHPMVDCVRAVVPVASGLLWGNVASGLVGALAALAREGAGPTGLCQDAGMILLNHGPLRGSGVLERLRFSRRSCCLYYRLPGGGTCGDCSLLRSQVGQRSSGLMPT